MHNLKGDITDISVEPHPFRPAGVFLIYLKTVCSMISRAFILTDAALSLAGSASVLAQGLSQGGWHTSR